MVHMAPQVQEVLLGPEGPAEVSLDQKALLVQKVQRVPLVREAYRACGVYGVRRVRHRLRSRVRRTEAYRLSAMQAASFLPSRRLRVFSLSSYWS